MVFKSLKWNILDIFWNTLDLRFFVITVDEIFLNIFSQPAHRLTFVTALVDHTH